MCDKKIDYQRPISPNEAGDSFVIGTCAHKMLKITISDRPARWEVEQFVFRRK